MDSEQWPADKGSRSRFKMRIYRFRTMAYRLKMRADIFRTRVFRFINIH